MRMSIDQARMDEHVAGVEFVRVRRSREYGRTDLHQCAVHDEDVRRLSSRGVGLCHQATAYYGLPIFLTSHSTVSLRNEIAASGSSGERVRPEPLVRRMLDRPRRAACWSGPAANVPRPARTGREALEDRLERLP